jgi:prenyltransferase beta subunit
MKRILALLCLVGPVLVVRGQTDEQKLKTVAYLQKLQTTDGGFLPTVEKDDKAPKPSLRATSSALRALKYFGGKPKDADACAKFVEKCIDKDGGGIADTPGGKPDVTTTAIGIMAMVELKLKVDNGPQVKYLSEHAKSFEEMRIAAAGFEAMQNVPEKLAEEWIREIVKMRNEDGTFGKDDGKARDTGGAAVTILRLGGMLDQQDNVLKAVRDGQRKDGGFGKASSDSSDLESTYRVMRLFHMLKQKPADLAALKRFVEKCRNYDGGYGVGPGQASSASGTYFASIILHWLDG